jgi:hypothetical protein
MRQMLEQGLQCGCPDLEDCIDCILRIQGPEAASRPGRG